MDVTNRTLIITASLVWIFLVAMVILLTWSAPNESILRLSHFARYLNDHNTTGAQLVVTFGGLILILLGAMLVILEVAPPDTGAVKVAKAGAGDVRIGTDEIAHQLEQELRSLPQLGDAQVAVLARGHKADVRLDLYVTADADLAAITDAACRRARDIVEGRMGVELAAPPHAQIHYRELRVGQAQATAPTTGQPAVAAPPSRNPYTPPAPVASSTSAPPSSEPAHGATESSAEDRPAGA
jgi:hypothetical protein